MRNLLLAVVGMTIPAAALFAQPAAPATQPVKAADVPVKAVVLFSSGVGYFEHFGLVKGNASAELRFKTNQINDILKSLVLQDMNGGKVSTITYPSQDPLAKTLRSFQIDITANPSLADLLNQIRGAKVSVTVGTEKSSGTVLGVEKKQRPAGDKGIVSYWVLNLIAGGNIRAIDLDEVRDIQLDDPQLQEELHRALAALSQARDQDKKPVLINFSGEGDRQVRIGYVVETPIWKTSYRLIIQEKPALQGWAIVENQTDNDWNDVQLSLVSGRPISFVQDLYQPLYIPRPVVKPELYGSLRPQTYEGGIATGKEAKEFGAAPMGMTSAAAAPAPMAMKPMARRGEAWKDAGGRGGEELEAAMDATASVASVASAAKMGELFQYTVGNVSLPRQRSAMIPIITDPIEVEKVSIYNQGVLAKNPLNGARLKNTTEKHLLAGPVTVLDGNAYAGDASIDNLPPGQERLLSYGIDLEVRVDATKNEESSSILTGKIVKGMLHLSLRDLHTQEYLSDNKGKTNKTLVVEHPIRGGWKLVDSPKPVETTENVYRFKGALPAGQATKLVVKEELVRGEEIGILPADLETLVFYTRNGAIPQAVRDPLARAVGMRQGVIETQRQIEQKQQQINAAAKDQERVRANMKAVKESSEFYNKMLTKLSDLESRNDTLRAEIEDLQNKLNGQRKELEEYLTNLNVG